MIRLPPQYYKVILGYYVLAIKYAISHEGWQSYFYMLPVWGDTPWGSETLTFMWLRRVSLLKEIGFRLIRIFTCRNCFYFSFTMSFIKLWQLLFVAIGHVVCKFSKFLINSCKQVKITIYAYLIMEAVTSESS